MEKTKGLTWNEIKIGDIVKVIDPGLLKYIFSKFVILKKTSEFNIGNDDIQEAVVIAGSKLPNDITVSQEYLKYMKYEIVDDLYKELSNFEDMKCKNITMGNSISSMICGWRV